jgi:hypothetical protein
VSLIGEEKGKKGTLSQAWFCARGLQAMRDAGRLSIETRRQDFHANSRIMCTPERWGRPSWPRRTTGCFACGSLLLLRGTHDHCVFNSGTGQLAPLAGPLAGRSRKGASEEVGFAVRYPPLASHMC